MFKKDFVIVDLETTGLSAKKDEIIEIGAIKVNNNEIIDTMDLFVKPKNPVPSIITNITGITNEMLKDACNIETVMVKFLNFIENYPLVFHNARFDMSFLNSAMNSLYNQSIQNNFIDTLVLSRKLISNVPNYKLGTLASYFDISYDGAHRSLRDCQITLDVYNNLSNIYNNRI